MNKFTCLSLSVSILLAPCSCSNRRTTDDGVFVMLADSDVKVPENLAVVTEIVRTINVCDHQRDVEKKLGRLTAHALRKGPTHELVDISTEEVPFFITLNLVDTVQSDGSIVPGKPWQFKTAIDKTFVPWKSLGHSKASWKQAATNTSISFDPSGKSAGRKAILYSQKTYQSSEGFTLTAGFGTGTMRAENEFSIGLVRADAPLPVCLEKNPFASNPKVYSLGVNIISGQPKYHGLNFTDPSKAPNEAIVNLDQSGTNAQFRDKAKFQTNDSQILKLSVAKGGDWKYLINGVVEGKGKIPSGFDLSGQYRVVVFARGFKEIKTLQHLSLSESPEAF